MWESRATETGDSLIEVNIEPEDYAEAKQWAKDLGKLRNSITGGRHSMYGRLGEIIVARYVSGKITDNFDYDVRHPDGRRLEVKTKVTTVRPKGYYECSVCGHNPTQTCDAFVFVRISSKEPTAWICGQKERDAFFREAEHFSEGDVDPRNNFKFHTSCFNIEIRKLDELK